MLIFANWHTNIHIWTLFNKYICQMPTPFVLCVHIFFPISVGAGDHRHQHGGIVPHFAQRRSRLGLWDAPRQRIQRRGATCDVQWLSFPCVNSSSFFWVVHPTDFPGSKWMKPTYPKENPGISGFSPGFSTRFASCWPAPVEDVHLGDQLVLQSLAEATPGPHGANQWWKVLPPDGTQARSVNSHGGFQRPKGIGCIGVPLVFIHFDWIFPYTAAILG